MSVCIYVYVFYKNPKERVNRTFILIIASVIAFSIGEAIARLSSNNEEGLLAGRIGYLGVIFMPLALLHLSFVFPRDRTMFAKNKYMLLGLYLIAIVLLFIFNLIFSVQDIQMSQWGYRVALTSKFFFIGIWFLATSIFAIFNFFSGYIQSKTTIERIQIKHIFYGGSLGVIISIVTNIVAPISGVEVFPIGSIALSLFAIFIGATILKYNLFRFKPMVKPAVEKKKSGKKIYKLEPSKSYFVREERDDHGYEIFTDQITHGLNGLCVTKYPPQKIRDKYSFEKTPILWFTFKKSNEKNIVNPKKLDAELVPQVQDFVKNGKQTMVYIDHFDQILLVRGFERTLQLISDIKTICEENQAILLLSINPTMFDEKQLLILEKEFLEIR